MLRTTSATCSNPSAANSRVVHDLLELQHGEGVASAVEQLRQQTAVHPIRRVLDVVDAGPVLSESLEVAQPWHGSCGELGRLAQQGNLLRHAGREVADLVEHGQVGRGFHEVQHVVEPDREPVDVLPVERGHERGVQALHDRLHDVVAAVFDRPDPLGDRFPLPARRGHQLAQQTDPGHHVVRRVGEQLVEHIVPGGEAQSHVRRMPPAHPRKTSPVTPSCDRWLKRPPPVNPGPAGPHRQENGAETWTPTSRST